MKRTLMVSVAALALAAGSTIAMSQGGGGRGEGGGAGVGAGGAAGGGANAPMNSPAGAGASGGASGTINEAPAPGRGAQDRAIPEKQQKAQQAPSGTQAPAARQTQGGTEQAPTTKQTQGERDKSAPTTKQSQDAQPPAQQRQQQTQRLRAPAAAKQGTAGTQGGAAMQSSNVSLTTEQKTVIRSKVLTSSAPRVTNVNFDIRIGTVVPRTVRIAPVPVTLVEIEPTWRGYMYFVSGDTIIVVEPRTLEIVAVLEV